MNTQRGITLLELLIAIAIAAMSVSLVTYFTVDVSRFGINLGDRLENQRELELTFRIMVSEIRSMGPGGNGAYPVAAASSASFSFFSDIDGDGGFEQVRYFLSGTTLRKGVIEPVAGQPVTYPPANEILRDMVHNVRNTDIFRYYDEGYPPEIGALPSPVDVASIRMLTVKGTTDKDTALPPLPSTLSVNITIRNLRGEI